MADIDTGVDYNHPDLAANMWRNPGEIPGNGVDDDGNGYVDDVYGIDTVNGDADPIDDHGHGTHASGTVAGVGNNGVGVVGVNGEEDRHERSLMQTEACCSARMRSRRADRSQVTRG